MPTASVSSKGMRVWKPKFGRDGAQGQASGAI